MLRFLNLGQIILCCGGWYMLCWRFSSIPGLYPLATSSSCKKPNVPLSQDKFALVENHRSIPCQKITNIIKWNGELRTFSTCREDPAPLSQAGATTWSTALQSRLQPLVMNMLPTSSFVSCLVAFNSFWSMGPAFCKRA